MGTSYHITVVQLPQNYSAASLQAEIDQLLINVNQEMSTYIPSSTISSFNESSSTEWYSVSDEFINVLQAAKTLNQQSSGLYDITVSPLIDLWGFGAASNTEDSVPNDAEIEKALALTGQQHLTLQSQPPAIKKTLPALSINLSSIAKGYGVDVVAEHLNTLGVKDYLVEIGGELRASGVSPRSDSWKIAIEKPLVNTQSVERIIPVNQIAVATSGDYRNYFVNNGTRYSHTLDSTTGRPITHALASVTVLHEQTMLADGWATALMALGEERGYPLAQDLGLAAYFIYKTDAGFATQETKAFTDRAGHPPAPSTH